MLLFKAHAYVHSLQFIYTFTHAPNHLIGSYIHAYTYSHVHTHMHNVHLYAISLEPETLDLPQQLVLSDVAN